MPPADDPTTGAPPNESAHTSDEHEYACQEGAYAVTITALRPRGAKARSFTVELSTGESLRLRAETVAARGLGVGDTVDAAAIAAWQRDDNNRRAVEAGLTFVSYRPRSAKEVADHFRKKAFDAAARDHALRRLTELGYVDDAAFARFWVESRDTHRPKGKRALAWELRQKGVADATIEDALARFGGDEASLAAKVARKRAATLVTDDPYRFRRQLGAFLARRGFDYAIVEQVVSELWQERCDADDDRWPEVEA